MPLLLVLRECRPGRESRTIRHISEGAISTSAFGSAYSNDAAVVICVTACFGSKGSQMTAPRTEKADVVVDNTFSTKLFGGTPSVVFFESAGASPNDCKEALVKVLMVITSHDQLGNTGRKTGFWLEELAAPYYVFKDNGVEITLASPKGGRPPLDPKSNEPEFRTDLTRRFENDAAAEAQLDKTVRLDSVRQEDFDTVFYPGGHGPMWDLAEDKHSIKLIESFLAAGKPIGIVCHSTGALRHVKSPDGKLLVQGKEVTGFTNGEEEEVGLTKVVPFLVEDEMLKLGPSSRRRLIGRTTWSAMAC
jgi:putative intracellular protease/amidase